MTDNKQKKVYLYGRFVGGFVPPQKAAFLRLLAMCGGGSTQDLINRAVDLLLNETVATTDDLINTLVGQYHKKWCDLKRGFLQRETVGQWKMFIEGFERTMVHKGIDAHMIKIILQEFKSRGR